MQKILLNTIFAKIIEIAKAKTASSTLIILFGGLYGVYFDIEGGYQKKSGLLIPALQLNVLAFFRIWGGY